MSKITVITDTIKTGGSLKDWNYDNVLVRSDVSSLTQNGNTIINGLIDMDIADVGQILAQGGEVEEYLMAIIAPKTLFGDIVPDGLPKRLTFNGETKTFDMWLVPSAEVWLKDDDTQIIFFTNPFAGNEGSYLTGSEVKLIHDISAQVRAITVGAANELTATGWEKL